jgi:hypothetical protein
MIQFLRVYVQSTLPYCLHTYTVRRPTPGIVNHHGTGTYVQSATIGAIGGVFLHKVERKRKKNYAHPSVHLSIDPSVHPSTQFDMPLG